MSSRDLPRPSNRTGTLVSVSLLVSLGDAHPSPTVFRGPSSLLPPRSALLCVQGSGVGRNSLDSTFSCPSFPMERRGGEWTGQKDEKKKTGIPGPVSPPPFFAETRKMGKEGTRSPDVLKNHPSDSTLE